MVIRNYLKRKFPDFWWGRHFPDKVQSIPQIQIADNRELLDEIFTNDRSFTRADRCLCTLQSSQFVETNFSQKTKQLTKIPGYSLTRVYTLHTLLDTTTDACKIKQAVLSVISMVIGWSFQLLKDYWSISAPFVSFLGFPAPIRGKTACMFFMRIKLVRVLRSYRSFVCFHFLILIGINSSLTKIYSSSLFWFSLGRLWSLKKPRIFAFTAADCSGWMSSMRGRSCFQRVVDAPLMFFALRFEGNGPFQSR